MTIKHSITLNLLSIISDMDLPKEQKEDLALAALGRLNESTNVIWQDDRIKCIRLNDSIDTLDLTITIDKEKKND